MKAPARPAMTAKRRMKVWERDGGVCYLCGLKVLGGEPWDVEHVIPWALAQDDSDDNLKVAHKNGCHTAKTAIDNGRIAKAKRQGLETGQQARRKAKGGSIKSAPFKSGQNKCWPKSKTQWPKRKLESRNTFKKGKTDGT